MNSLTKLYLVSERLGHEANVPLAGAPGASLDARYTYYVETNGLLMKLASADVEKDSQNIQQFTDGTQQELKSLMEEMTSGQPSNFEDYLGYVQQIGVRYTSSIVPTAVSDYVQNLPGNGEHYLYIYAPEHWIPWEILSVEETVGNRRRKVFWGDKCIVVRIPVMQYKAQPPTRSVLEPTPKPLTSVVNVVGDEISEELEDADQALLRLNVLLGSAPDKWCNLVNGNWTPMSLTEVQDKIETASIVHFTCHGRTDDTGYYLQLYASGQNPMAYRLHRGHVGTRFYLQDALVFANACTSDVPNLQYGTFITLGREFFESGASAFVGTVAPVPIDRAVRLAANFYTYLLAGETVGKSLFKAKTDMKAEKNPFYLFYCLYGNALQRFVVI
jgi:hypothetical protein